MNCYNFRANWENPNCTADSSLLYNSLYRGARFEVIRLETITYKITLSLFKKTSRLKFVGCFGFENIRCTDVWTF